MKNQILKCTACGKYTMNAVCACGGAAQSPRPPKYSVEDPYAKYRRQAKTQGGQL